MEKLIQLLKENKLSNTFIKNLGMEFGRVMDEAGNYGQALHITTELERLIDRSCMIKRNQAIDDLTKNLCTLYSSSKSSLENFLSFMDIADFIKREVNNADKD